MERDPFAEAFRQQEPQKHTKAPHIATVSALVGTAIVAGIVLYFAWPTFVGEATPTQLIAESAVVPDIVASPLRRYADEVGLPGNHSGSEDVLLMNLLLAGHGGAPIVQEERLTRLRPALSSVGWRACVETISWFEAQSLEARLLHPVTASCPEAQAIWSDVAVTECRGAHGQTNPHGAAWFEASLGCLAQIDPAMGACLPSVPSSDCGDYLPPEEAIALGYRPSPQCIQERELAVDFMTRRDAERSADRTGGACVVACEYWKNVGNVREEIYPELWACLGGAIATIASCPKDAPLGKSPKFGGVTESCEVMGLPDVATRYPVGHRGESRGDSSGLSEFVRKHPPLDENARPSATYVHPGYENPEWRRVAREQARAVDHWTPSVSAGGPRS